MSLKAKLEAVVYAAEEPVTLAQLAAIFADEVLQVLAEAPTPEPEVVSEQSEQIKFPGLTPEAEDTHTPEAPVQDVPALEAGAPEVGALEMPALESPVAESAVPKAPATDAAATASTEPATSPAEPSDGDEKKAARQRERRVRQVLQTAMDELIAEYANSDRGMEIREIAGGYRMATKPEYHDAVRGFVKSLKPPMKLSLQALETLAVIAYKQPVTAPEVSEIRGVDSGGVLGSLVSRKLITTAGRKQVIGRPILYKTTKEFLLRFGLKDVNDLPSMEEFEKMAGELAEVEGDAQDTAVLSPEASSAVEAEVPAEAEVAVEAEVPAEAEVAAAAEVPAEAEVAVETEAAPDVEVAVKAEAAAEAEVAPEVEVQPPGEPPQEEEQRELASAGEV